MLSRKTSQKLFRLRKTKAMCVPPLLSIFLLSITLLQALFKSGQAQLAIARYTTAAALATQRPPWEANQVMREELSAAISNRSAAYFDLQDYISALVDAETVISIRRNWSKGHFRKAKALLGLHRFREAADAVRLGLDFEPTNTVRYHYIYDD